MSTNPPQILPGLLPEALRKRLRPLPRPTAEPRVDQCPNFTHYIPFGGEVEVVLCDRIPGHDVGPDGTKHHGVYVLDDGEEVEFFWPQDATEPPA